MKIEEFLLSIVASLIASGIFIFLLLFLMRPRIKISPYICKKLDNFDNINQTYYAFKIVNMSWFSAFDISIELSSLVSYPLKSGINFRYTPLKLKTSKCFYLAPYRPTFYKKDYAEHALIVRTYDNIEEILAANEKSIKIEVTLRHGVTGLSKIHTMTFADCSEIRTGNFGYGSNFNIS